MSEQNIDNNVADAADIAAASAATEEFTNTIGDSIAPAETEGVEAAAPVHEGPIQTVGRRKRAVARVRLVAGSGQIVVNGREFGEYFPNPTAGLGGRSGRQKPAVGSPLNKFGTEMVPFGTAFPPL